LKQKKKDDQMSFTQIIIHLNKLLKNEKPITFRSSWILNNDPAIYRFIVKHIRTEVNDINWDKVVSSLDRDIQKKWVPPRYKPKIVNFYSNQKEVDLILKKHKDKLYIFISLLNEADKPIRDNIIVSLTRVAQKGNIKAEKQLTIFLNQIIQLWLERYPCLFRWTGHIDELEIKIKHCIRCYRFTGSFLGYLFKTLEYSARGLQNFQAYSLDSYIPGTTIAMIDTLTKDPQTGQVVRGTDVNSYYFH
jgi:hypothetical protein